MGYLRQHAIIVTGHYSHEKYIEPAHARAVELFESVADSTFGTPDGYTLVSPIMSGVVNDVRSFFIAPDGSKEGWGPSDAGDEARVAFVKYLRDLAYDDGSTPLSWVEVQYGDEELVTKIVNDSDEQRRKAVA